MYISCSHNSFQRAAHCYNIPLIVLLKNGKGHQTKGEKRFSCNCESYYGLFLWTVLPYCSVSGCSRKTILKIRDCFEMGLSSRFIISFVHFSLTSNCFHGCLKAITPHQAWSELCLLLQNLQRKFVFKCYERNCLSNYFDTDTPESSGWKSWKVDKVTFELLYRSPNNRSFLTLRNKAGK